MGETKYAIGYISPQRKNAVALCIYKQYICIVTLHS